MSSVASDHLRGMTSFPREGPFQITSARARTTGKVRAQLKKSTNPSFRPLPLAWGSMIRAGVEPEDLILPLPHHGHCSCQGDQTLRERDYLMREVTKPLRDSLWALSSGATKPRSILTDGHTFKRTITTEFLNPLPLAWGSMNRAGVEPGDLILPLPHHWALLAG